MLVLIILGLDVLVPLGTEFSLLYLIPLVLLRMWSSPYNPPTSWSLRPSVRPPHVGRLFRRPLTPSGLAVANRLLAVTVIGFTVMLSVSRKRAEDDLTVLRGLLPICSYCKKIRDDRGSWEQMERYIADRSQADFSHGNASGLSGRSIFRTYSVTHARQPCRVRRDKTDLPLHP